MNKTFDATARPAADPHYLAPSRSQAHVAIFYCNFRALGHHSHIGLGVNGMHTVTVLRRAGVRTDLYGVKNAAEIETALRAIRANGAPPSHVVIEAPWIQLPDLENLAWGHTASHFIVRTHSQIAFLQADRNAIAVIRQMMHLQDSVPNFTVAANSKELARFLEQTYAGRCLLLPNLYNLQRAAVRRGAAHEGRQLRIGCFGALRPFKNHTTAGAAALLIARQRRADLEFWYSVGRDDQSSGSAGALAHMFAGLPWAKLCPNPWSDWAAFSRVIAHMDLCLQPSFTESFNITTADAAACQVPSVTSTAIRWVPRQWQADSDDPHDVARVGNALLSDPQAGEDGRAALEAYVDQARHAWLAYLDANPT